MTHSIKLKQNPKVEFEFLNNGFNLIDCETKVNSGFYPYNELESVELNKLWFPGLAKVLRAITWILNMGVPYFPDGKSYKKANMILHFKRSNLGIWLTDSHMTGNARKIKQMIDHRSKTD